MELGVIAAPFPACQALLSLYNVCETLAHLGENVINPVCPDTSSLKHHQQSYNCRFTDANKDPAASSCSRDLLC